MSKPLIGDMPAPEKLHRLEDEEEEEHPIVRLLRHHRAWLEAQPEWVMLMALPRPVRRDYARQLAYELLGLPVATTSGKGREAQRGDVRKFKAQVIRPLVVKAKNRNARQAARLEKSRRRYQSISEERAFDLAMQEEDARQLEEYRKQVAPTPEEEYAARQAEGNQV